MSQYAAVALYKLNPLLTYGFTLINCILQSQKERHLPVSDLLSRTTVRLECQNANTTSVGTSFLYRADATEDQWTPLLITNRHVVFGFSSATLTLSTAPDPRLATPADAQTITVQNLQNLVTYHPDPNIDLAAIFLGPIANQFGTQDQPFQLNAIRRQDLVDTDTETRMRFVEDVLVVGYPQGIWDEYRNLPIFRSGVTASPAMLDYQNESKFLIDCSIFPGSSGSPVFLYNSGVVLDAKNNSASFGERLKLLGVVFAVQLYQANGQVIQQSVPTNTNQVAQIGMPNNLGVVVKSREILPLLDEIQNRMTA